MSQRNSSSKQSIRTHNKNELSVEMSDDFDMYYSENDALTNSDKNQNPLKLRNNPVSSN